MPIHSLLDECTPAGQGVSPLGGVIRTYLHWVVETTHAPQLFHLGSIIPAVCYEASRRGLTIGPTRDPFRMLVCLVSGPGSAKSTAKNRAKNFVQDWYNLTTTLGVAPKPYVTLKGSLPGVLDELVGRKEVAGPGQGTTPVIFDLEEASVAFRKDEVEDTLNELYDGNDFTRHLIRLQRDNLEKTITKPRIQGVFCATPSSLETTVTSNQVLGGLFSRFLFLRQTPTEAELNLDEQTWPEGRQYAMDAWIEWRRQLDVIFDTQRVSRNINISGEANAYLEEVLWPMAKKNIAEESRYAASMARIIQQARTIAAAFALSEAVVGCTTQATNGAPGQLFVAQKHMRCAIQLVLNSTHDTRRLIDMLGVDPVQRVTVKLEEILERAGPNGLPRRALHRAVGRPPGQIMDFALKSLVDNGMAVSFLAETGGRPATILVLARFVKS